MRKRVETIPLSSDPGDIVHITWTSLSLNVYYAMTPFAHNYVHWITSMLVEKSRQRIEKKNKIAKGGIYVTFNLLKVSNNVGKVGSVA